MSIAVSTVLKPSGWLTLLTTGLCLGIAVIAGLIGFGYAGNFLPSWRPFIALALAVIPVLASSRLIWRRKSLHIDISENGQIKVEEDRALAIEPRKNCLQQERGGSEVVS